ncbi:hypothetical protein BOTCAL_0042g00170 [Botryotinia calthae]|uniref:Uncharacterized protein n=1 Tax=Botryotinia calthae TaxID=38488 RepID=A0A4Y8DEK3_9HELO|nr:hypothetical protein BOTCAL_0042g00170 [Botryotinia calthae]
MASPDEVSVEEVPASTKDGEVEKADEQRQVEVGKVSTLRSVSLDAAGVKSVNQEAKKRRTQTKWSEKEEGILQGIIDNRKTNPETSNMGLMELDGYVVTKLADAGFFRTQLGVTGFRGRKQFKPDYNPVVDLVANMPESIRSMEANYEPFASIAREPVRRPSTVASQSATSLQEWNTLSKLKNSPYALNCKRSYGDFNGDLAGERTNAATAAAWKPQAQAYSMGTNGQQGFLMTSGSKSCEVAKTPIEMDLNMLPPSKRMRVTNGSKGNPVEARDDPLLSQPQSDSDRIEEARASMTNLAKTALRFMTVQTEHENIAMIHEMRRKEAEKLAAEFKKRTEEKFKEILRMRTLSPELMDYNVFSDPELQDYKLVLNPELKD